ncbi:ferredoxin--nitrite reductase [Betaproteobacteria bacterium GR16-43]|nr:ferredoxin--nitrite reductase [Betaproteobacteria bacterium GR16-43]
MTDDFTDEQKRYLEGFAAGQGIARVTRGFGAPAAAPKASGPEGVHDEARAKTIAAGGKLVAEEDAKAKRNGLDIWDEIRKLADEGKYPKGTDVFLWKFHGLFYVSPAQDSFMCRLRIPGGQLSPHQMAGLADLADRHAGGFSHVTTRANLQLREIGARETPGLLMGLSELGLTSKGSGADNIRNVTGSPTSGIDAQELIDTQPLCREMHHHILNHRELYGLPRKFNIAFDGAGRVSSVDDTNDVGFSAVRVPEGKSVPAGVYFRLRLGGITGHHDFARDEGVVVAPADCVRVAEAVVKVFSEHGDRTNRLKARMKYVIDKVGHEQYLAWVEEKLGRKLARLGEEDCEPRPKVEREGHIGFHAQKQEGLCYVGLVLPVGKLTSAQMRAVAALAARYGGSIRLTVWQNLLITHIPLDAMDAVKRDILAMGLDWQATPIRAGLVACTGNRGCKFSASDTKGHAMVIADYVEKRIAMDTPVNIHLTGCHHSCAQHYIGDIGLLAAKVDTGGDETIEGYHLYVGGGYGDAQAMAREVYRDIPAAEAPEAIRRMLAAYLANRGSATETFQDFANRHDAEALRKLFAMKIEAAA